MADPPGGDLALPRPDRALRAAQHRHRVQADHDMLNWLKANRKLVNAGKMKAERVELFEALLEMGEELRRVNQWG